MNSLKLSKRVIGIALSVLFVNAALADATSDARIQAYKANKLIPQHVVLPTSTGAADSDEVVVFNKSALSWSSTTALSASYAPLLEKYGDMTIDELRAAMGPAGTFDDMEWYWTENGWLNEFTPEQQEIRDYLSLIANNKLKSDNLESDEALAYLQEQFDLIVNAHSNFREGDFQAFPCEGLDFTGRYIDYADLSKCTGITVEQIMSTDSIQGVILPAITFTGDESFEGKRLTDTDLSNCTGITATQIMSASDISGTSLPALAFTGNESFEGKSLYNTDLSKCTGITAAQIMSASNISGTRLPALAFTGNESFEGKSLKSTDFSKCTGITATQIMSASDISRTTLPAITFTGDESFAGKSLNNTDLSKCTGITATQIMSASNISGTRLPAITFTGDESFAGKSLYNTDLSKCTGITGEQIMSASNLGSIKLPAIAFTGNESFAGKSLLNADFSSCTGITAAQIGSATNVSSMYMTTSQYNEWKSTLQSKFNGKYVFVDGVNTKIQ